MALPLVEISVDLASITFAPPVFDAGIGNVIIVENSASNLQQCRNHELTLAAGRAARYCRTMH